jgi:hypothetical protein
MSNNTYITWYFDNTENFYSLKVKQLINLFSQLIPEALPKEDESHEPPEFTLEKEEMMYLSEPFTSLCAGTSREDDECTWGAYKYTGLGFRYHCGYVELGMLQDSFLQPDWNSRIEQLFIETAKILQPFYAVIISAKSQAMAIILNEQSSRWEEFKNSATKIDDDLWMVTNKELGEVPKEIMHYNISIDFARWLDEMLEGDKFENVLAFNFNLYEGRGDEQDEEATEPGEYHIELIGADEFDADDEDWACSEVFTTREKMFRIEAKYLGEYEEALEFFIKIVIEYLESSSVNKNKLLEKKAVGVGFVSGDLYIVYKDGVINKDIEIEKFED